MFQVGDKVRRKMECIGTGVWQFNRDVFEVLETDEMMIRIGPSEWDWWRSAYFELAEDEK